MQKRIQGMRWGGVVLALSVLAGCGGADGLLSRALSGLAATGAGIANAPVTARCASGPDITGNTDSNGAFSLPLTASQTLPCMLQVTTGTPPASLYSYADQAGRVNITPITDLVVARALGSDPATAFAAFDATRGATLLAGAAAARTYVQAQVTAITGTGTTADPLTGPLVVGDANDKVLDALGQAMTSAGKGLPDLRVAASSNTSLTTLVPPLKVSTGTTTTATLSCDTSQYQAGAVRLPTSTELASFARTYSGSEGSYGPNPGDAFVATGSATLVLTAGGTATYNASAFVPTSVCLDTSGSPLYLRNANGHFDLFASGKIAGVAPSGKVVTAAAYVPGGTGGGGSGFPNEAVVMPAVARNGATTPVLAASDMAGLVGTYTGVQAAYETNVLVSNLATATVLDSCQLVAAADGTLTLSGGGHSYTQKVGDSLFGDAWTPAITSYTESTGNLVAFPPAVAANSTHISVDLGRGKLLKAQAYIKSNPQDPFSVNTEMLTCWMPINRLAGTVGGGTPPATNQAYSTGANVPAAAAGTWTGTLAVNNGVAGKTGETCRLVVADDGTLSFSTLGTAANTTLTAKLAGDSGDVVGYTNATSWSLQAEDVGNRITGAYDKIVLQQVATNAVVVTATRGTKTPLATAAYSCNSLTRQ